MGVESGDEAVLTEGVLIALLLPSLLLLQQSEMSRSTTIPLSELFACSATIDPVSSVSGVSLIGDDDDNVSFGVALSFGDGLFAWLFSA